MIGVAKNHETVIRVKFPPSRCRVPLEDECGKLEVCVNNFRPQGANQKTTRRKYRSETIAPAGFVRIIEGFRLSVPFFQFPSTIGSIWR